MSRKKGTEGTLTNATIKTRLKIFEDAGYNVSEAARRIGITRPSMQGTLREAETRGMTETALISSPNPLKAGRPFGQIVARRKDEFDKIKRGGTFRTPHKVRLPSDEPFCLVFLGDPHLDNPGTDLDLWERWIKHLDRDNGVMGICLGDWLDNWVRPLAHIYGGAETTVDDAWVLLEGYVTRMGDNLVANVSGNHDDWGEKQFLQRVMDDMGIIHRMRGLRLAFMTPGGHEVTVGLRHRFVGHSQWNAAHAITKAAMMGWRDDILVGGDKHISGKGCVKDPETGAIAHCYQVAAFKIFDDYAEEKGFRDQHISPAIAVVVDPKRPNTDPARITEFMDPEMAVLHLKTLRKKASTKKRANRA